MTAPDPASMDDAALRDVALSGRQDFSVARYMDELARRALLDPELLDAACEAITLGRKLLPHYPAPGWAAGARILDSDDPIAIERLLRAMDSWSPIEQGDLLRAWAGNKQEGAAAQRLQQRYGWRAKF